MKKRMILMLAVVAIILGAVFGLPYLKKRPQFGIPPQTVSTTAATSQVWTTTVEAVGSVHPVKGADIATEVAGIVEDVNFEEGNETTAGTLLVRLRDEDDVAELEGLKAAATLAELTYQRSVKLVAQQNVSQAKVDTDKAALDFATAQVEKQKALVAKKNIRAPFDGKLGIALVNPGQYVAAGTALVSLQSLDPIYVDFYLPQDALAQVKKDQPVSVTSSSFPGGEFSGTVLAINSKVQEATRNLVIRALIDNPDHLLLPGMSAVASVDVGQPQNYLTLPQTAITYNPYGDTVFVVEEKTGAGGEKQLTATQKFVTLGPTRGDQVAILTGLEEGDTVVTSGQIKLQNGSPVTINNDILPENEANPEPSDQ